MDKRMMELLSEAVESSKGLMDNLEEWSKGLVLGEESRYDRVVQVMNHNNFINMKIHKIIREVKEREEKIKQEEMRKLIGVGKSVSKAEVLNLVVNKCGGNNGEKFEYTWDTLSTDVICGIVEIVLGGTCEVCSDDYERFTLYPRNIRDIEDEGSRV